MAKEAGAEELSRKGRSHRRRADRELFTRRVRGVGICYGR